MTIFNPTGKIPPDYLEILNAAVLIQDKAEAQNYLRQWADFLGGGAKAIATAKNTLRLWIPGQPIAVQKRLQRIFEL